MLQDGLIWRICSTLSESIRELILLRNVVWVISLGDTPLEESRKHYNSIVVRYIYWGFLISCHCGKASSPTMIFKEYSLPLITNFLTYLEYKWWVLTHEFQLLFLKIFFYKYSINKNKYLSLHSGYVIIIEIFKQKSIS